MSRGQVEFAGPARLWNGGRKRLVACLCCIMKSFRAVAFYKISLAIHILDQAR